MTNEERILERLEAMEERLAFLHAKASEPNRLLEVLPPITSDAFKVMVEKLQVLHGRVDLNDFMELGQKTMLSVPNIIWALGALENVIDLCNMMSPAIAPSFQDLVVAMGKMESKGVFKKLSAGKNAACSIVDTLSAEDIANIGNSLAFLMQLLTKLAEPKVQESINTLVDILASINPSEVKPLGIFGLFTALNDPDVKKVLGLAVEGLKQSGKHI